MEFNREGYLVSDKQRECTKCGLIFNKTSKTVTLCNKCNSERVKSNDPRAKMLARAKSRAKEKGIYFDLTINDIFIPEICPVFGFDLKSKKGKPGGQKCSPALDRIDSTKGYTKDNIQIISHLANMMKAHSTNEEMIIFAKWVLNKF